MPKLGSNKYATLREQYGSSSSSDSEIDQTEPSSSKSELKTVSAADLRAPKLPNNVPATKTEKAAPKKQSEKEIWNNICRSKPDAAKDREKERNLQHMATKGVVQLFNAVSERHKQLNKEISKAGGSEFKRQKAYGKVEKQKFEKSLENGVEPPKKKWKALSEDFVPENDEELTDEEYESDGD